MLRPSRNFTLQSMVAKRVVYEGRVQGVGFRFCVKELARGYEIVGGVKNLIDGRVQLEVQGEMSEVDAFLRAILESHLRGLISRHSVQEVPKLEGAKGFEIRW
jgi:acylphosphatase